MFWTSHWAKCGAAMMALAALAPLAAQAETIVVRASGPSAKTYTPGKKLADNSSVTLKAGDVVTLLDGRGTRTLRGPGTFGATASAAGSDTRTSLAALLETKRVMRARTGAVRGGVGAEASAPRSPNLWYVDISQTSVACVPDPANVRLWRPSSADGATVTITAKSGGASAPVIFGAGEAVALWPATLSVTDGAVYSLSWPGLAKPIDIALSVMAPGTEGLESMASTLISRKCDAQLNLLVETVALPDPAPDSEL
ncbi:hypothetical protein [Sphingobium subterraneum]|uniref:Uncharacterized protein n=1 Tax=Sphingobium subterraneum TaxID=627688 RepID=A0A841J6H4_9SPHN|nr:hypothetical protein [Sphingobium subterraneum]MBB6124135.1 hypothetical protein [Sphingobium subterraneum]